MTIIFDLGGVLIDWNPEYVFRELIPDVERRQYFFENICTHDWNVEQDAPLSGTPTAGPCTSLDIHPDGTRFAVTQTIGKSSYPDTGSLAIYEWQA